MLKPQYDLPDLLQALVSAESIMGVIVSRAEAHVVDAPSVPSTSKDGKRKKKRGTKGGTVKEKSIKKKGNEDKKGKGNCFNCGEKGHWRKFCPKLGKAAGKQGVKQNSGN